jgi:MFS transporter, DHA1 family, multidrug resistance protein
VYGDIYGFNLGEQGLTFLTIGIACLIGVISYNAYLLLYLVPAIKRRGLGPTEERLVPALLGVILMPMGLFMFGRFNHLKPDRGVN